MHLYIGNATRLVYDFCYTLPERKQDFLSQKIQPASQVKITGDLTSEEIDHIVKSHQIYGLIPQDKIDSSKAFHGTCYSIGKPITAARLTYLVDHNLGELVEMGREIRRANAIAQNNNVQQALIEADRPERITALDMTLQQENQDPRNDVPQMSVGLLVTADGDSPHDSGRQSRRRRAA